MLLLNSLILVLAVAQAVNISEDSVDERTQSDDIIKYNATIDIFSDNGEKINNTRNGSNGEGIHPKTVILDLTNSNISVIESCKFANLSWLTALFLDKNKLISTDFMQCLPESVVYASASSNNITEITPGDFTKLKNFDTLNLKFNEIKVLKANTMKGLSSLTRLELSHNLIVTVEPEFFQDLKNLEYLDLSTNQIVNLDEGVFSTLVNIQHILLSVNNLKELQRNVFGQQLPKNLVDITLYNNPLIDNRLDDSSTGTAILKSLLDIIVGNRCSPIELCLSSNCTVVDVCY